MTIRLALIMLLLAGCAKAPTGGGTGFTDRPHIIFVRDKLGFIDRHGTIIIQSVFDGFDVLPFAGNYAVGYKTVKAHGVETREADIIDRSGRVVWTAEVGENEKIRWVEDAVFVRIDAHAHFFDLKGKFHTAVDVDEVGLPFADGMLAVKKNGKWGYMDSSGKLVIAPQFDFAPQFSEGLASVETDGKTGFIDESGKWVIPARFDGPLPSFSDGLALVKQNKQYFFIDKNGNPAFAGRFEDAQSFCEGCTWVRSRADDDGLGCIDHHGRIIFPTRYQCPQGFSEGLCSVETLDGQWGYVDKEGRPALFIPGAEGTCGSFEDGIAFVRTDKRNGYVDKKGNWVYQQDSAK